MGRFFRVLWLCGLLSVSSSPLSCCRHVNQGGGSEMITGQPNAHDSLISCVNSTTRYSANTSSSNVFDSRIAFATFASSDIYSFASFSSLLVSLYAQSKSYEFRLLNADTGDDHSNDDMRWNKMRISWSWIFHWISKFIFRCIPTTILSCQLMPWMLEILDS